MPGLPGVQFDHLEAMPIEQRPQRRGGVMKEVIGLSQAAGKTSHEPIGASLKVRKYDEEPAIGRHHGSDGLQELTGPGQVLEDVKQRDGIEAAWRERSRSHQLAP